VGGMNINKSEFLEHVKLESAARKSTALVTEKVKLRKQLNRDVEKFIKNGGQVEQLPGTEFKPRPRRSTVEAPSSYATSLQVNRLIKWCNASSTLKPRRTYLSELTGIPLYRIRGSITTSKRGARLTKDEHQKIVAVMAQVEELERENEQGAAA
jgi:hypothetical protein